MKPLFAFAFAVLPLPVTLAQATGDLVTRTPVAAMTTGVVPAHFVGVPSNTPVAPVLELSTVGYPQRGCRLRASVTAANGTVAYAISSYVMFLGSVSNAGLTTGTSPSTTAAGAVLGPVEFLARVQTAPGTVGQLRIYCTRSNVGTPGNAINQFLIDVHADGTPEVTAVGSVQIPVTVGANGELRIRFQVENHAAAPSTGYVIATSAMNLTFVPDPVASCSITPYGTPCGGAASSGSELVLGTTRAITLLGSGGFAHSPVLSAFGTQNVGPVLPGGCSLHTDASIVVLLASDAAGFAVHSVTLPVSAIGTLYHQFVPVELGTFAIRASNGLDITCVR